MTRRDISLSIALCASLLLHALLLGSVAELYNERIGSHIWMPGFAPQPSLTALLVMPDDSTEDPRDRLGEQGGKGDSTDASPGDVPMLAPKAPQAQPFLSLDPAGPGKMDDEPTDSVLPLGRGGQAESNPNAAPLPPVQPAPPADASATTPPVPFGVNAPEGDLKSPFIPLPPIPTAEAQSSPTPAIAAAPFTPPAPQAQALAPSAQTAMAEPIPGADRAADPAPQGDSESDPVTLAGSAEFRRGSAEVRMGRQHKITRPHLTLAAQADLLTLPSPIVVLKLTLDESGKVTSVDIFRSSGSPDVDQPCKLAAYNWWFEPTRDAKGRPVKDVILFAIHFI